MRWSHWAWSVSTSSSFGMVRSVSRTRDLYDSFRAKCRPPMERLSSIAAGELWYHDVRVSVIACLAETSLLVSYAWPGTREEIEAQFGAASAWLYDEATEPPKGLDLRFAAREEPSGGLRVRCFNGGDWAGIATVDSLSASRTKRPHGWDLKRCSRDIVAP